MEKKNHARFMFCNNPNCFGTKIGNGKPHGEVRIGKSGRSMPIFSLIGLQSALRGLKNNNLIDQEDVWRILTSEGVQRLPNMVQTPEENAVRKELLWYADKGLTLEDIVRQGIPVKRPNLEAIAAGLLMVAAGVVDSD